MKLIICIFFGLLFSVTQAEAQANKKKKTATGKNNSKTIIAAKSVRGAEGVEELGKHVFDAIQNNNFEAIEHFFPTETDLTNTEKKTPDEDLQLVLEDHSPADLQVSFRNDFTELQNKSLEQRINFKDLNLMEVQAVAAQKANRLVPVNLLLSDANNQTMALVFEAIKINGRYFLFQHLKIKQP